MPQLRSSQTTEGRRAAPARSLWRAAGVDDRDFGKPIVAIVNSYSQFVPGHVHLRAVADIVAEAVRKAGGIPREMNTIAVDDGIAMGHDGMLYSLPSRDLIADSIEYVVEGHKVDAMVCISNCDKITPGMAMATMRLNLPTVLVSGGPMEAGKAPDGSKIDLIDTMVASMDPTKTDEDVAALEASSCPTCDSCSGMFTANSMNCLAEALGLALPGNGTLLATHAARRTLFERSGSLVVELAHRWYREGDATALPRGIATPAAFRNAMSVDIAMGGSTNTILHLLAMAREGAVDFDLAEIDRLSRRVPYLCKVAPATSDYHIEDVHRAGGIPAILGELTKADLLEPLVPTVHSPSLAAYLRQWDIGRTDDPTLERFYRAAPGGARTVSPMCHETLFADLDRDRRGGCIRSVEHAYSRDGGLAVLFGSLAADGAIVKTGGVPEGMLTFAGPAQVFESQEAVVAGILNGDVAPGTAIVVRYEGPKGGPGMQEMLHPTTYLKARGLADSCALITDGRFSGGSAGLSIGHVSPEAAERGAIALVRDGDRIEIDIPNRRLDLNVSQEDLAERAEKKDRTDGPLWRAAGRTRQISKALELYSRSVTSASDGAVRSLDRLSG